MEKIPATNIITATIANIIHNGENTHTQLHFITLANFKPINSIVKAPAKPIPPASPSPCNLILSPYKNQQEF